MIRQKIYLKKYDWIIYVYYPVYSVHVSEIIDKLLYLECPVSIIRTIPDLLSKDNQGCTYTRERTKESLVVIGKTSSRPQFLNSLSHEIAHVANHIANEIGVDLDSEEFCYLIGDISQESYDIAKYFLCECDCCADKIENLAR